MSAIASLHKVLVRTGGFYACYWSVSEWWSWKSFQLYLEGGNPFFIKENMPASTKGVRAVLECTTLTPTEKGYVLASFVDDLKDEEEQANQIKMACDVVSADARFHGVLPHMMARSERCLDHVMNQFDATPATSGKRITTPMLEAAVDTRNVAVVRNVMQRKLFWDDQVAVGLVWYAPGHARKKGDCETLRVVLQDPRVRCRLETIDNEVINVVFKGCGQEVRNPLLCDDGQWKELFAKDARDALVTADLGKLASIPCSGRSPYLPVEVAKQAVRYWVAQSPAGKVMPSTDVQWEEFLKFGKPDEDALLHAIVQGRSEVVRRLLESPKSRALEMVTGRDFLAVRAAMVEQQVECLQELLAHNSLSKDAKLKAAWATVPEVAAHGSNLDVVLEVLKRANGTFDASTCHNVILRGAVRTSHVPLLKFLATQDSVVEALPPSWKVNCVDHEDA